MVRYPGRLSEGVWGLRSAAPAAGSPAIGLAGKPWPPLAAPLAGKPDHERKIKELGSTTSVPLEGPVLRSSATAEGGSKGG